MSALRTAKELRERLGLGETQFHEHQKRGVFRDLVAKHPVGRRKYDGAKVDRRYPAAATARPAGSLAGMLDRARGGAA